MNERPKACPACRGTVLIKSGHACGRQRWKCKGQASASFWMDTRKDATLAITTVPAARLRHVLDAAREAGCDLAIIDTPPLYEVHCVKRYLLRANAVCWTKS